MKVSIIIPIFNSDKYLAECLDSLLIQDNKDYEIICVNDGSTDSSQEILDTYSKLFYNFRIINQTHSGLSEARNQGIAIAKGEYIYFVDSDDVVCSDTIEKAYKECKKNDLDLFLFSFVNFTDDEEMKRKYCSRINSPKRTFSFDNITSGKETMFILMNRNEYYNMVWIQMVKNTIITNNNIKFKKGIVFEDVCYTYQLLLSCEKVNCSNFVGYKKRIHDKSICGREENLENITSLLDNCINTIKINSTLDSSDPISKFISNWMLEKVKSQFDLHYERYKQIQASKETDLDNKKES